MTASPQPIVTFARTFVSRSRVGETPMRSDVRRGLFGIVGMICTASLLAADSPSKDDLAEYRTVKTARTREITPARPGHAA